MAYLNRVSMIGNLTREPELKTSQSGLSLLSFGVASNRSFKNKQTGELEKDPCFIDVSIWGNAAEYCGQRLKKGNEVFLEGRLKFNTWQDQSGVKHAKHLIIADKIIPMSSGPISTKNAAESRFQEVHNKFATQIVQQAPQPATSQASTSVVQEICNDAQEDDLPF